MFIYDKLISAAEDRLKEYDETASLLEYPEVMADKAYYISLLEKHNSLNFLKERLDKLKAVFEEESFLRSLLSETRDEEERSAVFKEISSLLREETFLAKEISKTLGGSVGERAYCRIKLSGKSQGIKEVFSALLWADLTANGVEISDVTEGGQETSFIAEGEGAQSRILPLCGSHTIVTAGGNEWLCVAVSPVTKEIEILDKDIKIDVFHSHGAGGQNINKVETAVRATYIPTGLSVVCQDERSQLKNKTRAIENLKRRVSENSRKEEKQRLEEDIAAQFSVKNTPITFYASDTSLKDTRMNCRVKLSLKTEEFFRYLDALTATTK